MRCKHDIRLFIGNGLNYLVDRRRSKRILWARTRFTRLQDRRARRYAAHIKDLRPTETEKSVPDDQAFLAGGELTRDRLHAKGPATRDDRNGVGVVNPL